MSFIDEQNTYKSSYMLYVTKHFIIIKVNLVNKYSKFEVLIFQINIFKNKTFLRDTGDIYLNIYFYIWNIITPILILINNFKRMEYYNLHIIYFSLH